MDSSSSGDPGDMSGVIRDKGDLRDTKDKGDTGDSASLSLDRRPPLPDALHGAAAPPPPQPHQPLNNDSDNNKDKNNDNPQQHHGSILPPNLRRNMLPVQLAFPPRSQSPARHDLPAATNDPPPAASVPPAPPSTSSNTKHAAQTSDEMVTSASSPNAIQANDDTVPVGAGPQHLSLQSPLPPLPQQPFNQINPPAGQTLPTSTAPNTTSPVHELERRRALFVAKARGSARPTGPLADLAGGNTSTTGNITAADRPSPDTASTPAESAPGHEDNHTHNVGRFGPSENAGHGFRSFAQCKLQIAARHQQIQPQNQRQQLQQAQPSKTLTLSRDLLKTYTKCNPEYQYAPDNNPRRVLTKPSKPARNDGFDNEDCDYILYVNDIIGSQEGQQYLILDILGQGTFGQVVKCQNTKTNELVAVKVIKNKPAYYNQSLVEVAILEIIGSQYDRADKHHLVRMKDTFNFRNHLCIVFEMLNVNLYELIKQNQFRGLSTNLVRVFVSQILDALVVLNRANIIHCDLKPENILLKNLEVPFIKVIDFGSACHENQTVYTYIQSRFYRSPEILMGLPYTSSIDMWSLGCIAAELFLGLPLFPGSSEYNQMSRIVEMMGVPPNYMCERGKTSKNFFIKSLRPDNKAVFTLKSMEQYAKEFNTNEQPSKRYFNGTTIVDIINSYPIMRRNLPQAEIEKEMMIRRAFIDFLHGLLNLNPLERWSPQQAKMHPFITDQQFVGKFVPPILPMRPTTATGVRGGSSSSSSAAGAMLSPASTAAATKEVMSMHGASTMGSAPPADDYSTSVTMNAATSEKETVQLKIESNSVSGGESREMRSNRPRAATISSSKVQAVPPQLQRLAAIQQQTGNPNIMKKEAAARSQTPKTQPSSVDTAVQSEMSVGSGSVGVDMTAAQQISSNHPDDAGVWKQQSQQQQQQQSAQSQYQTQHHARSTQLQPLQITVPPSSTGARSADTSMTPTQHLVMHQYQQIQSKQSNQQQQQQQQPWTQVNQYQVPPSTFPPPTLSSTQSHLIEMDTSSATLPPQPNLRSMAPPSAALPPVLADTSMQQVVGTFADIQIQSRQGMMTSIPLDMAHTQNSVHDGSVSVPLMAGPRRMSLTNLDNNNYNNGGGGGGGSLDRRFHRYPQTTNEADQRQNWQQHQQQQHQDTSRPGQHMQHGRTDSRPQQYPPPMPVDSRRSAYAIDFPIRKAQSQFVVAEAVSQRYHHPSHPMSATATLFPLTAAGGPQARGSDGSLDDVRVEGHPRHGNMGERHVLPSRLPSAGTSAEWEPFDTGRDSWSSGAMSDSSIEMYPETMGGVSGGDQPSSGSGTGSGSGSSKDVSHHTAGQSVVLQASVPLLATHGGRGGLRQDKQQSLPLHYHPHQQQQYMPIQHMTDPSQPPPPPTSVPPPIPPSSSSSQYHHPPPNTRS